MGMLVQKGLKVFVNIAWDSNVPPPPEGSEEVIQKAMLGEHLDDLNPEGWYIPVIVSGGRQDKDKGAQLFLLNKFRP
jgi:PIH1 N-terminal domain